MTSAALWKRTACLLALSACSVMAFAAEDCASDTAAVTAMRKTWDHPAEQVRGSAQTQFHNAFDTVRVTLQPYDKAAAEYGQLAIKAKKDIKSFDRFSWVIAREGDYWLAADSGVWFDVINADGKVLQALMFNHGLRCAGIYKAVKFHLSPGTYQLMIASEAGDSVRFAAQKDVP